MPTFALPDPDPGLCNALRRSLLSDVGMEAPSEIEVRRNTSWQTDEYLAHRIGLIPFRRVGNGTTMTLRVQGPGVARAVDVTGPAFEAVHAGIEILTLPSTEQALDLVIHFDEQKASRHARYSRCCGVGMRAAPGGHELSFDTVDGSPPLRALLDAVDALDRRIDGALLSLARQPDRLPESI